jgi:hypothetical protein
MDSCFAIAVNLRKLAAVALLAVLQTGCAGTVIGAATDTVVEVAKVPGKLTDAAIAVVKVPLKVADAAIEVATVPIRVADTVIEIVKVPGRVVDAVASLPAPIGERTVKQTVKRTVDALDTDLPPPR